MGVCVSNGLFSLFPCKVLPTLTISWFPKLVFFGSIIFLLHSTSKPLHLLLLHSMSSPGWFLLVLQAQVRGYQLREAFLHPHGDPSKHYILILFMKQITTCKKSKTRGQGANRGWSAGLSGCWGAGTTHGWTRRRRPNCRHGSRDQSPMQDP